MENDQAEQSLFAKIDAVLTDKIGLGDLIESGFEFVTDNYAGLFDFFSINGEIAIEALTDALTWIHPLILIALVGGIAYAIHRRRSLAVFTIAGLMLIYNLGYWQETMETVALVVSATAICVLVGVPLGIVAAQTKGVYTVLRPILDLMQTIPTFVYLIPALILFGLGVYPGLIATIIFAIPAPIRLTYEGIRRVPKDLVESGAAFGATRLQTLVKIELRHAMPVIMAGITQCIMLSLSMVVIAALVGADGLGEPVVRALNTVNISMGFESGLCIVILAIILDRLIRYEGRPETRA